MESNTNKTHVGGCDQSLLDDDDFNDATPTFNGTMVMTSESESSETTLNRYIRSISGNNLDLNRHQAALLPPPANGDSSGKASSLPGIMRKSSKEREAEEMQHVNELTISDETNPASIKPEHCSSTADSRCSSLRVEIQDLEEDSINITTSTLRKCKQLVLNPYWALLIFVGWRAMRKDTVQSHSRKWFVINLLYTSIIILLLFYTYSYEILSCEWKLDVKKDTHMPDTTTTKIPVIITTTSGNGSRENGTLPASTLKSSSLSQYANQSEATIVKSHRLGCDHIFTAYIIPNFLHLVAYVMGLYYFRYQESEQLYALMEKVFLQATPLQARTASQRKMIVKLRSFLIIGAIWVLITTVVLQCLYASAFDFPKLSIFVSTGHVGYWTMYAVQFVGRTVFNSVILAIMINFATQCEMVKFYVRGLAMRLQEKSTDLQTAMKDILLLRQSLGILNGVISKMTSLVCVILAELTIIGVSVLFANEIDEPLVWVYRTSFATVWASMLAFPFFQGARVNSICLRIQKIAVEMRVFGYKGASILDLDSFLQFTTLTKLKAKLLHMPLLPSYLIFFIIVTAFILLFLVEINTINNPLLDNGL